jgi:CheY-like chemotaxis protein
MGGDIYVASEPGVGSTFAAVLRLKRSSERAPAATPAMAAPMPHVLLALDRPIERRALRLMLEGAGIPVEDGALAQGLGLVASAAAAGEPFTAVLVDGMAGNQTTAALLAHARSAAAGKTVQGIALLDTAAKAAFGELSTVGFDAYLVRPARPQSLMAALGAGFATVPEAAEPAAGQAASERRGGKAIAVLLVEDNDINALLAQRLLEKSGCDVRRRRNGREAVQTFERILSDADASVDLVLMDVHMPVVDGLEALRAIRALYAGDKRKCPPIVAVTANAFEEDRRQCLDAGMDDYLAKPFDREDLDRVLQRWCGGDRRTRAA